MNFRALNVLFVVTFVVCSSAFASADGDVDAKINAHQSRRLPFQMRDWIKSVLPGRTSKVAQSGDEATSPLLKGQKALDKKGAATAKSARTADDAAQAAELNKLSPEEVKFLTKEASGLTWKRRRLVRKILFFGLGAFISSALIAAGVITFVGK